MLISKLFHRYGISKVFEEMIQDIRNSNTIQERKVTIERSHGEHTIFNLRILPSQDFESPYYPVILERVESDENLMGKHKLRAEDMSKIKLEENIAEIIEVIKDTFPFSFVDKIKIQQKINKLEESFWIRGREKDIILINEKFEKCLLGHRIGAEFKEEKSLETNIDAVLAKLEKVVIDTGKVVILSGVSKLLNENDDNIKEIIQIPIFDSNNNVEIIIGLTRNLDWDEEYSKENDEVNENEKINKNPILILDKDNYVISSNEEFYDFLNIDKKFQINQFNIKEFFGLNFTKKLEQYKLESGNILPGMFEFDFEREKKENLNITASVRKIVTADNKFKGLQIEFEIKSKDSYVNNNEHKSSILNVDRGIMYDIIMHTSPEPMFIYDIETFRFLDVNDSALILYGYKKEQFLTLDLTDVYSPEDIKSLINLAREKIHPGIYTGPWKHRKKDGSQILVELSITKMDYKGKSAHFNMIKDVTGRVEIDKKLQLFKSAFENTNNLILITDRDGFIIYTNEAAEREFGWTAWKWKKNQYSC